MFEFVLWRGGSIDPDPRQEQMGFSISPFSIHFERRHGEELRECKRIKKKDGVFENLFYTQAHTKNPAGIHFLRLSSLAFAGRGAVAHAHTHTRAQRNHQE